MGVLTNYEPKEVLRFFEEICSIAHGSTNTTAISDYLVKFAEDRGLSYRQDEAENVIIRKPGTAGYENSAVVIIQGHIDMVAVKDDDCDKNMDTDGLDAEVVQIDGEDWITAKGTSLGGDDGIAVAYALALLDSDDIPHPPLECVFTTDEEIGMLGAAALDVSDLQGRIFINMDSEDEGVFTVSCAGGVRATGTVPYDKETKRGTVVSAKLSGFAGGHSGVEINKGRMNACIACGRAVNAVNHTVPLQLVHISGGAKDNAIATFAEVSFLVPDDQTEAAVKALEKAVNEIKAEYASVEKGIVLSVNTEKKETVCFTKKSTDTVLALLMIYPNGVRRMNPDMKDMVQTSLNLGVMQTTDDAFVLTSALRSSSATEKEYMLNQVKAAVALAGGTVTTVGEYPGWEYMPESLLRDTMVAAYKEQYGSEPVVEGIHAGLECGLFASKINGLDCISYGPMMRNVHTTGERLNIPSVERTWKLTKNALARLK